MPARSLSRNTSDYRMLIAVSAVVELACHREDGGLRRSARALPGRPEPSSCPYARSSPYSTLVIDRFDMLHQVVQPDGPHAAFAK
jgi:hypothetical protein